MTSISNGYSTSIQAQQSYQSTTDYAKGTGQQSFDSNAHANSERFPTQSLYNQFNKLVESIQESPKHDENRRYSAR